MSRHHYVLIGEPARGQIVEQFGSHVQSRGMGMVETQENTAIGYPKKRARTRQQIMRAALSLMAKPDLGGLTVNQVVHEADIATGTFYNHFSSLSVLIDDIANNIATGSEETQRQILDRTEDPALGLMTMGYVLLSLAETDAVTAAALPHLIFTQPTLRHRLRDVARHWVEAGVESGRFTVTSQTATIDAMTGVTLQAMQSMLVGKLDHGSQEVIGTVLATACGIQTNELANIIATAIELRDQIRAAVAADPTEPFPAWI